MKAVFRFYLYRQLARVRLGLEPLNGFPWVIVSASEGSELYKRIGEIERQAKTEQPSLPGLICTWTVSRRYSKQELLSASLFHIRPREPLVHVIGDLACYDFSHCCPHCRAGKRQITRLRINTSELPRNSEFLCTAAEEWLVSEAVVADFERAKFRGIELEEVEHGSAVVYPGYNRLRIPRKQRRWFQIKLTGQEVQSCHPTTFGQNPFDAASSGKESCPYGHIAGMLLTSELHLDLSTYDGSDFVQTTPLIHPGAPNRLFVVSSRFRSFWLERKPPRMNF